MRIGRQKTSSTTEVSDTTHRSGRRQTSIISRAFMRPSLILSVKGKGKVLTFKTSEQWDAPCFDRAKTLKQLLVLGLNPLTWAVCSEP
mmetsp:Transcript_3553/g.5655  ORF Transcript_3553/g.5655 Transcript_3553/m.5655 type:complete len:88 (-) Transcript_3553:432-695(-)